jgi:hypothetical protein
VPERIYQEIMSKKKIQPFGNPNVLELINAATDVKKARAKRRSGTNVSARNVLYTQALNRFLKLKRGIEKQPIRVELIKSSKDGMEIPVGKMLVKKEGATPAKAAAITEEGELEELNTTPESPGLFEQQEKSSYSLRKKVQTQEEKDFEKRLEKAYNYIIYNKAHFGITGDLKILNEQTKLPIQGSDAQKSIARILINRPNIESPSGTKTLRSRINKDPNLQKIIAGEEGKQTGTGKKRNRENTLNTILHRLSMRASAKEKYAQKVIGGFNNFRPELWRS